MNSDDFRTQLEELLQTAVEELGVSEVLQVLTLAKRQTAVVYDLEVLNRLRPPGLYAERDLKMVTAAVETGIANTLDLLSTRVTEEQLIPVLGEVLGHMLKGAARPD